MSDRYNDLNHDLENLHLPPPQWVIDLSGAWAELGRSISAEFRAAGFTTERVLRVIREAGVSIEQVLRFFWKKPRSTPPVSRYKAHGRRRSRRELRDIHRQRRS